MSTVSTDSPKPNLYAAAFTPSVTNPHWIELNLDPIKEYTKVLAAAGCKGVFICGTNGEGESLDLDQRERVTEEFVKHKGELDVIVHIGATAQKQMIRLARHADDLDVAGVAVTFANRYATPHSTLDAVESLAAIADEADDTPFYYYHIPSLYGGDNLDIVELMKVLKADVPNFAGIKFSVPEYSSHYLRYYKKTADELGITFGFGVDEEFEKAVECGITDFIGSTYNLDAPLSLERYRLIKDKSTDHSEKLAKYKELAMGLISLLYAYEHSLDGFIPRAKALMGELGGVLSCDFGEAFPDIRRIPSLETIDMIKRMDAEIPEIRDWSNATFAKKILS